MSPANARRTRKFVQAALLILIAGCGPLECPVSTEPAQGLLPPTASVQPSSLEVPRTGNRTVTIHSTRGARLGYRITPPGLTAVLSSLTIPPGQSVNLEISADTSHSLSPRVIEIEEHLQGGLAIIKIVVDIIEPFSVASSITTTADLGQTIRGQLPLNRAIGFTAPLTLTFAGFPSSWTTNVAQSPTLLDVFDYVITPAVGTMPGPYTGSLKVASSLIEKTIPITIQLNTPAPVADFTPAIEQPSVTVEATGSAFADITIARTGPPIGNITLSVSGLPPGVQPTFSLNPVSGTTSRLTLAATGASPAPARQVTVTATAGNVTKSATFALTVVPVPAIAIAAQPSSVSLQGVVAQTVSIPISITRTGNVGAVTLEAIGVPSTVSATFVPPIASGNSATLQLTVIGTTPPQPYPITIRGTSGSVVGSTPFLLTVVAPPPVNYFTIAFAQPTLTVAQGESVELPLTLSRFGTMIGAPVQLIASALPPFSNGWVTLASTTGTSARVNLVVGGNTTPGPYQFTVTGTGASGSDTANISLTVVASATPNFALIPTPSTYTVFIRSASVFTVAIQRTNGFTGAVTLSAASTPAAPFSILYSTPLAGATSGTIDIYASDVVTPGTYTLTLTGTSGALVRTALITLVVLPP